MQDLAAADEIVRFGVFELDANEGVLRRNGMPVRIQPQPLRALTLLVANSGRTVSRRVLVDAIWGTDTHVDFEGGLNYCMKHLRAALGDDAGSPRFIATVPRRGYRFIAPITRSSPLASGAPSPDVPAASARGSRWRVAAFASCVALGAATAAMLLIPRSGSRSTDPGREESKTPTAVVAEAFDLYLKGRYQANQMNRLGLVNSLESFRAALDLDPGLAEAYAALAVSHSHLALRSVGAAIPAFSRAAEAANQALELDESLADAHAALGLASLYLHFDWTVADLELRRALELRPEFAQAHLWQALVLTSRGDHRGALIAARRAQELEPASRDVTEMLGWLYYLARRYDDAVRECRRTLELEPRWGSAYRCIEMAALMTGHVDEAVESHARLLALLDRQDQARTLWEVRTRDGIAAYWALRAAAGEGGEPAATRTRPMDLVIPLVYVGRSEAALDRIEAMVATRDLWAPFLAVDPVFDAMRSEPRFQELLGRANLLPE